MTLPFTIQIAVFNETHALEFSAFYFDRLAIPVRYVLGTERSPEAEATFRRLDLEPHFFPSDKICLEYAYEAFSAASPTDWILRLDCDELPSRELIEFCRDFVLQDPVEIAGFERHHLLWRNNRFLTATTERFTPPKQRQWRLYHRRRVAFNRTIHSPGLHLTNKMAAPPEAAMFHLAWVFLTWEDRLKKSARYDKGGQLPLNRANQIFPLEEVEWQELSAPFLRDTFAEWLEKTGTGSRQPWNL